MAWGFANALGVEACRADDVSRILAICGAWGVSTIGELPDAPRAVVIELIRKAKRKGRMKRE